MVNRPNATQAASSGQAEFDASGYAIRSYHGLKKFGTVYGLIFSVFQVGGATGTLVVGLSRDATGSFFTGLAAMGVLNLISGLTFLCLGAYRFLPHAVAVPSTDAELEGRP